MGDARKSLMFRLGQFFGHVARGATGPVSAPGDRQRRVVSQDVQERTVRRDGAVMTLRRTTIDEVEVRPETGAADSRRAGRGGEVGQENQA